MDNGIEDNNKKIYKQKFYIKSQRKLLIIHISTTSKINKYEAGLRFKYQVEYKDNKYLDISYMIYLQKPLNFEMLIKKYKI